MGRADGKDEGRGVFPFQEDAMICRAARHSCDTRDAVVVTIVHSPACHLCDDADAGLAVLAACYPLVLDRVDIRSDRGRALVRAHLAPMSPLVLVDGAWFSSGRLPRRKLVRLLEQRLVTASGTTTGHRGRVG